MDAYIITQIMCGRTHVHEFLPVLLSETNDFVVPKGTNRNVDSYSEITQLDAHFKKTYESNWSNYSKRSYQIAYK